MPIRTLIVDDDRDVCESVKSLLELEGFVVDYRIDPKEIFSCMENYQPDILLLDQNLEGEKGTDWLKTIRDDSRYKKLPVIMLTGVQENTTKVFALNSGADDYVVKPFAVSELAARIRAVLRRVDKKLHLQNKIESNGLVVDKATHEVTLNGKEISVTLTEFKIVYELLANKNEVLSRDHLREKAIGKANVTDRTIDVHLASLRKKLGDWAVDIKTIRGVGYRYTS